MTGKPVPKQKATETKAEEKAKIKKRADWRRRIRQSEKMARVLRVLQLIQSRGRWDTKNIAEELGCSERTVYRDLDVLEFAGVPHYREEGTNAIRVRPDYRFPIPNLTDEEVLGQALATAATHAPGLDIGPGAAPTTRKLAAASEERVKDLLADAARLVCVLDLKLADHSRHHETIKTLQFAMIQAKQVTGLYESPYEPSPVSLRLHPYRLCLIKNAWYLVGRPHDSAEVKTFRITRFKTLRMLDQPAQVPPDFDLKTYFGNAWAVYRGSQSYHVEIRFSPEAARVVTETVWHHTQKAKSHSDGSVTLTFRVDGLEEIAGWLLSWAGNFKVVAPGTSECGDKKAPTDTGDAPGVGGRTMNLEKRLTETTKLLAVIKERMPEIRELWKELKGHWQYEDRVYRFYHQSFKVFAVQDYTQKIVGLLQSLAPHLTLNPWFMEIVTQGTGKEFDPSMNQRWTETTRPMLEAFFHARYFLEMVRKYGRLLKESGQVLPSGWAAVLELYQLR